MKRLRKSQANIDVFVKDVLSCWEIRKNKAKFVPLQFRSLSLWHRD